MPNYFRTPDALVDAVRAVLSGKQTETQEDIIRKADVKMVKVKLPDGRIVMRRDRPEIKVGNEEIDPVNPKALKKMFKDRKDKDIDNDGDSDDSDEYLHKKRQAISKAIEKDKDKKKYGESMDSNKKDLDNVNDIENINKDPKPVKVNYKPNAGDEDELDEATKASDFEDGDKVKINYGRYEGKRGTVVRDGSLAKGEEIEVKVGNKSAYIHYSDLKKIGS